MEYARLDVYIRDLGEVGTLGLYNSVYGKYGSISINLERRLLKKYGTQPAAWHQARSTAGHELFHVAQGAEIGFGRFTAAVTGWGPELSWLMEATASWSEQHIYVPDQIDQPQYGFFSRHETPDHWRLPLSGVTLPEPAEETDKQRA